MFLYQFDPCHAEPEYVKFSKQCRPRSAFFLYAAIETCNYWNHSYSHRIGGNRRRQYYQRTLIKNR